MVLFSCAKSSSRLWSINWYSCLLHILVLVCDKINWYSFLFLLENLVTEKCDIFTGQWVPDSSGPYYTSETCQYVETHQNCMKNGRPDSGYIYWRWKPSDCELSKFDPQRFLDFMRNKSFAFIGDSISRNHVQSLLCTLSQVLFLNLRKTKYIQNDLEYLLNSPFCFLDLLLVSFVFPCHCLLMMQTFTENFLHFQSAMWMEDKFVWLDCFLEVWIRLHLFWWEWD